MEWLVIVLVASIAVAAVSAGVGAYVSGAKGRGKAEGAWFGGLLGPLGVLIAALMPNDDHGSSTAKRAGYQPLRSPWEEPDPEPPDPEEEKAFEYLGGITPEKPKAKDEMLDQIADVWLTPEERLQKENRAIRSLKEDFDQHKPRDDHVL